MVAAIHGLILTSFCDYLSAVHGATVEAEIVAGRPRFLVSRSYPDEEFVALLERAVAATGLERDDLLHEFGAFAAEVTFARLHPELFAMAHSAAALVLTVERPIHELVRAAIPGARPPQLAISDLGDGGVMIVYDSPRRLCALLRGLVEGTARHYHETAKIDEVTCMHRGDPSCTLEVRFAPARRSVAPEGLLPAARPVRRRSRTPAARR